MFDPITLGLLGGGAGLLLNKKDPLKGALLGGAIGAGGGLLAGAGGAGGASGLLGNPMTAASYGTNLGSQQTAMLAAQEAGMGSMPLAGSLMGNIKAMQPAVSAIGTGVQAAQAFNEPEMPMQPPQLAPQTGGQTLQALAQGPQFDAGQQAEMRRKRRMGLLGGMA